MTIFPVLIFSLTALSSCGGAQPESSSKRRIVTSSKTENLPEIVFVDDAVLPEDSGRTLDAIAATLEGNPDIVQIGIVVGATTKELAERRGDVIVELLIERGIPAARLENQPSNSESGQVDFVIIRRANYQE